MTTTDRRTFLKLFGTGAVVAGPALAGAGTDSAQQPATSKPIAGSWISILWDDRRHSYWNDACARFTAEQWD